MECTGAVLHIDLFNLYNQNFKVFESEHFKKQAGLLTFTPSVDTKEYYSKETIQWEIKAHNRTGTVEQMDANMEVMAREL